MSLKKPKYISSGYEQIRCGKLYDLINIEPQKLCSSIKIPVLSLCKTSASRSGPHPVQPE